MARKQLFRERKKLIKAEVTKMVVAGLGAYVPSKDPILASEVFRQWMERTGGNGCRCEKPQEPPPPEQPKKFGLRTTKLKCYNQTETGHDEVYLVSIAVDGRGNVFTLLSPKWSIDDGDDDVDDDDPYRAVDREVGFVEGEHVPQTQHDPRDGRRQDRQAVEQLLPAGLLFFIRIFNPLAIDFLCCVGSLARFIER